MRQSLGAKRGAAGKGGAPGWGSRAAGAPGTREAGRHRRPAGPLQRSLLRVLGVPPSPLLGERVLD